MTAQRFVIAVKRESRGSEPGDWLDVVRSCAGAELVGASGRRAVADLEPEALSALQAALGAWLHFEPEQLHRVNPPGSPSTGKGESERG